MTSLIEQIDGALRARGTRERAEQAKAYLKSDLTHYGASVPAVRSVAKAVAADHPGLRDDELVPLVAGLWAAPVHERRMVAVELLVIYRDRLRDADMLFLERLLRESRTWALVDPLAVSVAGPLVERREELTVVLDRWAQDQDFWVRRAALLALLGGLRRGEGDFERFSRYADTMLDDKEFFLRKAIGWVLRETAKKRPSLVYAWLLPRAARASGLTVREASKPLTAEQRTAILAARQHGRRLFHRRRWRAGWPGHLKPGTLGFDDAAFRFDLGGDLGGGRQVGDVDRVRGGGGEVAAAGVLVELGALDAGDLEHLLVD
jgi:3-methyladenine DNA glycosylase AlkD